MFLTKGGKNFLLILWETIYGVVYLPLEGCRQNHILGFIMGLYTSAVSIAIKPIVGLYDFMVSIADVKQKSYSTNLKTDKYLFSYENNIFFHYPHRVW